MKYKEDELSSVRNVLILISASSGEVDWILPVCHFIKKNYQKIKLSVLFNAINYEEIIRGNDILYDLLKSSVHKYYDFGDFLPSYIKSLLKILNLNFIKKSNSIKVEDYIDKFEKYFHTLIKIFYYKKILNKINPNILLKDISPDIYGVRRYIVNYVKKIGCRQILFPHATELHRFSNLKPRKNCYADDILITSKWMEGLSCEYKGYKNKTHIVGNPRYDDWWIQYLLNFYKKLNKSINYSNINKTIFLFFTQYPHSQVTFSRKTASEILDEVISTIFSYDNSYLIVKPHPREDISLLKNKLKKYDKKDWSIDMSHPIYLSSIGEVIISMGATSVVLDSLSIGKPVIEYYKYSDIDYKNIYGELGVIISANNVKELKSLINQIKKDPDELKEPYIKNFRKYIPKTEDEFTKKAVNVILNK